MAVRLKEPFDEQHATICLCHLLQQTLSKQRPDSCRGTLALVLQTTGTQLAVSSVRMTSSASGRMQEIMDRYFCPPVILRTQLPAAWEPACSTVAPPAGL